MDVFVHQTFLTTMEIHALLVNLVLSGNNLLNHVVPVQTLMSMTPILKSAFVQPMLHLSSTVNVELVVIDKFTTQILNIVKIVQKMLLSSQMVNASLVQQILTTINQPINV